MKQIRLEIPLDCDGVSLKKVWLKVNDSQTEAFEDEECNIPIISTVERVTIEVEAPEELQLIEVIIPNGIAPTGDISLGWSICELDPNWRIPGLENVTIIFDDAIYEVPVINEKPDRKEWDDYNSYPNEGACLFLKTWALAVYAIKSQTIGAFHWHYSLIKEA